ncbi:aminotransferase-like domain-containing protein [Nitratidesulfovibrio vulgaris]|uniref:Transcriptional regulator, GntR family n=2 Tax=Nitratidesulfovibrio vulgaris TaxID=881 RepID=Q72G31_NITV2|nr:PLP-dependent aminotransferase family protein [Nitratidesulfovibrio vulgaris]GEB81407.1 GntR family transcriptional regulator [Desulfovibrio desulfuricans]HBW14886.1 PLP-dependent aminotransferase family protein [Desulfovibrio sp.]AAS94514.1 transcriptional regulator, GntR family [Nitratidesulfovibrio vulgaris str. Hildenborough]ABM29942.1 transcriptional regulator, GntR family [Nitratidesulfovibrio vulgaris DP4]ADP85229.1 transcriptional regulator, GntR family with aminotransferase domain 
MPPRPPRDGESPFAYHQVERHVTRMIEDGRWRTGDRLPSLRQIATSMGVSIATVVHAYTELERKGVIEARPRSGHYVGAAISALPTPAAREQALAGPRVVNRSRLISTVLEAVGNHELVPFGVLCPDTSLLPLKALVRIMGETMRSAPQVATGYETVQGNAELRRRIAWRMGECGMDVSAEGLVITTGAVEALYIALRALTRPGDIVVIQSPTYYCFLQLLETLGLRAIEAPSSPEKGIDPEAVRHIVDRHRVACCIFSPNFNNPDGSLTPDDAKREILDILAPRGIHVIEDDVAADLHYGPVRPSTFSQYDRHGLVTLCSSFSKTVAPGFRVGWMAPGRIFDKAMEVKATTNVCCPTPTQMALARYLEQGLLQRHLRRLRTALVRQMEAMRQTIACSFPEGTSATRPLGGGVLWVRLPEGTDGTELFYRARDAGIAIAPGSIFSTQDSYTNYVRLGCNGVWDDRMAQGLRTLGELARLCTPEARALAPQGDTTGGCDVR